MPSPSGRDCGRCLAAPPQPHDATFAAFAYAFPVDRLVQAFKYQGRLALAEWSARSRVRERIGHGTTRVDCIVALPLAVDRQRERGYNQAAEIARTSRRKAAARFCTGVRRVRATPPQADLPWKERATNVRGAFACDAALAGMNVAVVDDVMTTGATLRATRQRR